MHRDPTPHDRAPLDSDSTGYDPREHEHGQHAVARTTTTTQRVVALAPNEEEG